MKLFSLCTRGLVHCPLGSAGVFPREMACCQFSSLIPVQHCKKYLNSQYLKIPKINILQVLGMCSECAFGALIHDSHNWGLAQVIQSLLDSWSRYVVFF